MSSYLSHLFFFFFNDTATTEIYTLSLHDALPISSSAALTAQRTIAGPKGSLGSVTPMHPCSRPCTCRVTKTPDRKSTRLNSSHGYISYAVFCLKKKKKNTDKYYILDVTSTTSTRG